jgi:hypothetical protein
VKDSHQAWFQFTCKGLPSENEQQPKRHLLQRSARNIIAAAAIALLILIAGADDDCDCE